MLGEREKWLLLVELDNVPDGNIFDPVLCPLPKSVTSTLVARAEFIA